MTEMRVCTQCGFTYAEFQTRGLLGCAQCYACFEDALWADLLQMHPGLHQHSMPSVADMGPDSKNKAGTKASTGELEDLAGLQEMLNDALRGERYEEAAGLHRRIQIWKTQNVTW